MRATLAALVLLLTLVTPAGGDGGLEGAVAAAYFPRTHSAQLHQIAHERAVEVVSDWSHNGMRAGTAEVLAWNSGYGDESMSRAIAQWIGSPDHHGILSDRSLTAIGCAVYQPDERTFYVCVLTWSPEPEPAPAPAPAPAPTATNETPAPQTEPVLLPNTAMP